VDGGERRDDGEGRRGPGGERDRETAARAARAGAGDDPPTL